MSVDPYKVTELFKHLVLMRAREGHGYGNLCRSWGKPVAGMGLGCLFWTQAKTRTCGHGLQVHGHSSGESNYMLYMLFSHLY